MTDGKKIQTRKKIQRKPEEEKEKEESILVTATPEVTKENKEKEHKKKRKSTKKERSEGKKVVVARGKRKTSVARATIIAGKGTIRINGLSLNSLQNKYIRDIIPESLRYLGPEANNIDISVNVYGGGSMGQAQAARTAIANALILYFQENNLKNKFIEIDRSLVVEDTRRVESKKYRGPKARARYQKSYR